MLGMVVASLMIYASASHRALEREIAESPRDPETGVLIGAEAVTLDPTDAATTPTRACLMIHGFIGSRQDFADLGERLAEAGLHVRMMRLPGHGTTPLDFERQSADTIEAGVLEEFRALSRDYDAVDVVGFSMGGALATLLSTREPVARLVLVSPYYGVTYRWFYLLPVEAWNALARPFVRYVVKSNRFIQVNRPEAKPHILTYHVTPTRGVHTLIELGRRARRAETLATVRCPTLVVATDGDRAASPARIREAYEALGVADKTIRWIDERSNHHLMWDYDREEVKDTIVEFLAAPPRPESQ